MPTKNPRIHVTFNESDNEIIQLICKKKNISMSSLVRKVMEDWLEEYEDMLLARRAEESEKKWIEEGMKTITHEELCLELGIESNIQKKQKVTSKNFPRTSRKESSVPSKADSRLRRPKLANH